MVMPVRRGALNFLVNLCREVRLSFGFPRISSVGGSSRTGVFVAAAALVGATASAVPNFSQMRPDILETRGQQAQFTRSFSVRRGYTCHLREHDPDRLRKMLRSWAAKIRDKVRSDDRRIADTGWSEKSILKALGRWNASAVYTLDEQEDPDGKDDSR